MPIIMFSPIHLLLCNPPKSNTSAKQFYIILRYEFNPSVQAPPAPWLLRRSGGLVGSSQNQTPTMGIDFGIKKQYYRNTWPSIHVYSYNFWWKTCYNLPTPPSARGARQRKPTDSPTSTGLHACGFDGTELWERPAMVLCRAPALLLRNALLLRSTQKDILWCPSRALPVFQASAQFPEKKETSPKTTCSWVNFGCSSNFAL